MDSNTRHVLVTLGLGLGLGLGLAWVLGGASFRVRAAPGEIYCVTPGGGSYPPVCDQVFTTVQAAVDAASGGEEIRVAASTYTDIHRRDGITQVVYISQTVTVRGGYTTTNGFAGPPDPAANPTTLDAQGQGRVLYIASDISPTVEGLRITGGDATGLGGYSGYDAGGGVYVCGAPATISGCVVTGNTASTADRGSGGGLCLLASAATLSGNTVVSNTASTANRGWGGGLYLFDSAATLSGNTVQSNTASTAYWGYGGGLYLLVSATTLSGNTVQGNTASTAGGGVGGGLYLDESAATLSGNTVFSNTASTADYGEGGGLCLRYSAATLSGNTVFSNTATLSPTATGQGGGLWVYGSSPFTLTNNLVADNHANTAGSGLWFDGNSSHPRAVQFYITPA
jgi:hypothetical protein